MARKRRLQRAVGSGWGALELARTRPLTAGELTSLAQRLAESNDPAEVERLKTSISRGFYGD